MPNLVGTGLNQVPTNSMLGGLAYQDPEHASIKDLDLKNLSQINSEIADTAVDVFVYDTRKDSDGGAWRKRTQNTSWYNETLGTATRGTRKEFPAVAVIVAQTNRTIIYDGDDPKLPMWMVFNRSSSGSVSTHIGGSNAPITSIFMLNANLCAGFNNNGWGVSSINFITDSQEWRWTGGIYILPSANTIAKRNVDSNWVVYDVSTPNIGYGNANVNDVSMTALPNAPIDSVTGLPFPTIAIGAQGGASVIKEDKTIVDYNSFNPAQRVEIDSRYLYASTRASGNDYLFKSPLLSSDGSYAANIIAGSGGWYANSVDNVGETPTLKNMTVTDMTITKDSTVIRSGTDGIEIFDGNVETIDGNEAIMPFAYITSDYNTGYMVGDIKGAFLSGISTANAVGTELHPNGNSNFSSTDVSYITNTASGTATVTSNQLVLSGGTAGYSDHIINITTEVGQQYVITIDYVTNNGNNGSIGMYVNGGYLTGNDGSNYAARTTGNTYSWYFTADAVSENIDLVTSGSTANTYTFDNWSIKKVEEDRSLNNNGLQVFGTVTKEPVATGADLVGYSGNGTSNYLEQPHNSDLDFGANSEFSVTGWMYNTNVGGGQFIFDRSVTHNGSRDWQVWVAADLKYMTMYLAGGQAVVTPNNSFPNNVWFHFAVVRIGGHAKIYINGVEKASTASTSSTIPASNVPMKVLYNCNSATKLALFRISGSVPTPEQIKKMYEDEKCLFHENAKATLHGSSDAVTALAYDDTTNLLHVGTSAGRSDFQGLRRINNTTTAVTTAISASNGLVAEQ